VRAQGRQLGVALLHMPQCVAYDLACGAVTPARYLVIDEHLPVFTSARAGCGRDAPKIFVANKYEYSKGAARSGSTHGTC
jgi:hypothetical protein